MLLLENFRNLEYITTRRVSDMFISKNMEEELTVIYDLLNPGSSTHLESDEDPAQNTQMELLGF